MKKLLLIVLAFGSFSLFAQDACDVNLYSGAGLNDAPSFELAGGEKMNICISTRNQTCYVTQYKLKLTNPIKGGDIKGNALSLKAHILNENSSVVGLNMSDTYVWMAIEFAPDAYKFNINITGETVVAEVTNNGRRAKEFRIDDLMGLHGPCTVSFE